MKTILFLLALAGLALAGKSAAPPASEPPADWSAWAKWVENLHPVSDKDGHGPDIGSDEWARALDRGLKISDGAGHGPDIRSGEWRRAVEKKLLPKADAKPEAQRKLLSSHDTEARFVGLADYKCMGRTALCPDRCGHSGKMATFEIVKYIQYRKPGEYGDPKQERFQVLIEDNMKNVKVPASIRDAVLAMKPGTPVHLKWNHDYVTREGANFPERVITLLEKRKE